jgi:hypothetical protein
MNLGWSRGGKMKRRNKPSHRRGARQASSPILAGYAWYQEKQWDHLHQVCPDSDEFPTGYQEWLEFANGRFDQLRQECHAHNMKLVKVFVDVDELLAWCRIRHLQPNGQARSQFVAEKVSATKRESLG